MFSDNNSSGLGTMYRVQLAEVLLWKHRDKLDSKRPGAKHHRDSLRLRQDALQLQIIRYNSLRTFVRHSAGNYVGK